MIKNNLKSSTCWAGAKAMGHSLCWDFRVGQGPPAPPPPPPPDTNTRKCAIITQPIKSQSAFSCSSTSRWFWKKKQSSSSILTSEVSVQLSEWLAALPVHVFTKVHKPPSHPTLGVPQDLYGVDPTLRAPLSGTLLQTLPDLVTPLKGHSLSPRSCPATRSAPSRRFRY